MSRREGRVGDAAAGSIYASRQRSDTILRWPRQPIENSIPTMSHQSDLIATDINAYLKQHENKELLRFLTCGSVDDGKSTLIGRLLYDSKMIYEDQLAAIERDSKIHGTTGRRIRSGIVDRWLESGT